MHLLKAGGGKLLALRVYEALGSSPSTVGRENLMDSGEQ